MEVSLKINQFLSAKFYSIVLPLSLLGRRLSGNVISSYFIFSLIYGVYSHFPFNNGATGPTGAESPIPDDVFASFNNYALSPGNATLLPLNTDISDPTGQIVSTDGERITLAAGYYLVSYQVSALFESTGYFQITPFYNNAPAIINGIYFMVGSWTGEGRFSGSGSVHFIIYAPAQTQFSLTFNSNTTVTELQTTITFFKLRRAV